MYRNLNDYEILYMVGEESENFNILLEKYKPLIFKIVKDYINLFKKYGYELDDLMQLGYIALFRSSNLYSRYSDSMFYSYLKKAVMNTIITEIRRNNTLKRNVLNNAFSYDIEIPNTDLVYLDLFPSKNTSENTDLLNFIVHFKNSLDFTLSCVFELLFTGFKDFEIAILLDENKTDILRYIKEIKAQALTYKCLFLD